mmetsp:Transcript_63129/g.133260  ORF Transcript_63129/g.133260 Transcript_63129/m.133260 type:complete len:195 (+) Transcript_63129:85-669(+)
MDALALLAADDDDDDEEEDDGEVAAKPLEEGSPDAEEEDKLDFAALRRAGFEGGPSLSESDMYKRMGPSAAPAPSQGENGVVSKGAVITEPPAEEEVKKPTAAEIEQIKADLEALERAKLKSRKRAGTDGHETIRQKNARKMKMGQANFSLKDDRDCVNPFVDTSTASHVQSWGGKRLDKRSSAKQVSNLSFTS